MGAPGSTGRTDGSFIVKTLDRVIERVSDQRGEHRERDAKFKREREGEGESVTEQRGEPMINIFIKPSHVPRVSYLLNVMIATTMRQPERPNI